MVVAVALAENGEGVLQQRFGDIESGLLHSTSRQGDQGRGNFGMVVAQHVSSYSQHIA